MQYLICYDIPDNRRRTRLAKFLLDYGHRVQYSVFEFEITKKVLDILMENILEYIEPEEDSVRIYSLCAECSRLITAFGPQMPQRPSSHAIIV